MIEAQKEPGRESMTHIVRAVAMIAALSALMIGLPNNLVAAEATSPVGLWTTIDDETNVPRSIVEITEVNGELQGRVTKIFYRPDEKPDQVGRASCRERMCQ